MSTVGDAVHTAYTAWLYEHAVTITAAGRVNEYAKRKPGRSFERALSASTTITICAPNGRCYIDLIVSTEQLRQINTAISAQIAEIDATKGEL